MNQKLVAGKSRRRRTLRVASASIAALGLRAVLDLAYVDYVSRYFGSSLAAGALAPDEHTVLRMVRSYAIVLVLASWLASSLYRRWRPSGTCLILCFVVVVLPLSSLYGLSRVPTPFVYAAVASFAILLLVTRFFPRIRVPSPSRELLHLGIIALMAMSAYVYAWLVLTGGLRRLNFDLRAVYEVRAEYTQARWPFIGYLLPWQANVVNVGAVCYALHRRSVWLLGFAGVAQLALFSMTGHRSFLLVLALAGGIYSIWSKRHALRYLFCGTSVLILAAYGLFRVTGDHLAPSLLIRRLFFVPIRNHFIYYDFFSRPGNPFVMLSNSILSPFVRYPYEMPVTRVISWAYWGRAAGPNVGYLGDAFAQFGFVGMFLFSVILGVFLRVMDSVGRRLPSNLVAAVIATPAMALTNSPLFTSLLTQGLIPALAVVWLLRGVEKRRVTLGRSRTVLRADSRSRWMQ